MHALWEAPTTSDKDRKRLLRTLLGDVTIAQSRDSRELRVGLRWKSGASQELTAQRLPAVMEWRRASDETVALARELGPRMNNTDLAAGLNAAGHRTGTDRDFDATAAGNLRYAYRIGSANLLTHGELTVRAVATRLGTTITMVQGWLKTGKLVGRRTSSGHWAIPFSPDIEAACRELLTTSSHFHPGEHDRQPGEVSIAELAARLNVKPDVVYYWAQRGHIPTRRGSRCRLWIPLTDELETQCQQRITDSYKHPERVASPNHTQH
jgi:DNA-binding transcriptional regulator YiaG